MLNEFRLISVSHGYIFVQSVDVFVEQNKTCTTHCLPPSLIWTAISSMSATVEALKSSSTVPDHSSNYFHHVTTLFLFSKLSKAIYMPENFSLHSESLIKSAKHNLFPRANCWVRDFIIQSQEYHLFNFRKGNPRMMHIHIFYIVLVTSKPIMTILNQSIF